MTTLTTTGAPVVHSKGHKPDTDTIKNNDAKEIIGKSDYFSFIPTFQNIKCNYLEVG